MSLSLFALLSAAAAAALANAHPLAPTMSVPAVTSIVTATATATATASATITADLAARAPEPRVTDVVETFKDVRVSWEDLVVYSPTTGTGTWWHGLDITTVHGYYDVYEFSTTTYTAFATTLA